MNQEQQHQAGKHPAGQHQVRHNVGNAGRRDEKPWYKQFWPWFIIAFPATSVIVSMTILWLAISHPDASVLDESDYRALKNDLKAQPAVHQSSDKNPGKPAAPATP